MVQDIDEMLSEFDDLTDDVSRSKHEFFASNLRRWFAALDGEPETANLIQRLESGTDFDEWSKTGLIAQRGMGHGRINLPDDADQRLGVLISLFRSLTKSEDAAWRFSAEYISSERNLNDNVADLVDQVFLPFARDLRRRIDRHLRDSNLVPAADRIVHPDHNTTQCKTALHAIERTKKAVQDANDYPDADDQKQRLAELEAGVLLLKAPRFRLQALKEVLINCLTYLAKKFADQIIGITAAAAITALFAWLF